MEQRGLAGGYPRPFPCAPEVFKGTGLGLIFLRELRAARAASMISWISLETASRIVQLSAPENSLLKS